MKTLTRELSSRLIAQSNDLSLVIQDGIVKDVACGDQEALLNVALPWVGQPWIDTVTSESRPKIEALLKGSDNGSGDRWRQVNHPVEDDLDLPIMYKALRADDQGKVIAIGRDLRQLSQLQQRLLDVQHSLERDYAKLHQAEVRYRMLFTMASEAILFVDADSRKILEANPAAGKILDTPPNKLINRTFPRGFSDNSNDVIEELLLQVRAAGQAEPVTVNSTSGDRMMMFSARLVRREEGPHFLIRLTAPEEAIDENVSSKVVEIVNRSPTALSLRTQPAASSAPIEPSWTSAQWRQSFRYSISRWTNGWAGPALIPSF